MSTGLQEVKTYERSYEELIDQQLDYHRATAKRIWPLGTVLHCDRCDRRQTATVGELAKYLAHGWPECHGQTMHIGDAPDNPANN